METKHIDPPAPTESASGQTKPSKEKIVMRARNVGLYYNNKRKFDLTGKHRSWVLKDISFDLYEGECIGIMGKNGAGKSSLLRVLAGIHKPDRGTLQNYGHTVALLTLGAGFIKHLSGRDNMILSAQLLGLPKKEVMKRIDAMIEYSELGDSIDDPIFTYSSGMRSRLGFSVAIQSEPDILLIDEKLGTGDKDFRKKSAETIREMVLGGKTVVLISHNARTVEKLSDRAMVIQHGKTVIEGDVYEVSEYYNGVTTA